MKRILLALMLAGVPLASTGAADAPSREKLDDPLPPGVLLRLGTPRLRHTGAVGPVVFSPDGKRLASGDAGRVVRVWDVATGRQIRLLQGCQVVPDALAFSPDGKRLAVMASNNPASVQLWDLTTGMSLWMHDFGGQRIEAIAVSPNGKFVVQADDKGCIRLLDSASGKERFQLKGRDGPIQDLRFAPDGGSLLVHVERGPAVVWDLATRKEKLRVRSWPAFDRVCTADFSADGKTLYLSGWCFTSQGRELRRVAEVRVIEAATGKLIRTRSFTPTRSEAEVVAVSPDGKVEAVSCWDGMLRLWDVETGKLLHTIADSFIHHTRRTELVFSPDGRTLTVRGENVNRAVRLWNVATGTRVHRMDGHECLIRTLAVSPDGSLIATGGADRAAFLWDSATGKLLNTFPACSWAVRSLAFSPDGRTLVVGDVNEEARLWDVRSAKVLHRLHSASGCFFALAFVPDGKSLVSGHASSSGMNRDASALPGCIRIWDVATGQESQRFEGQPIDSSALIVRADGRDVLALHADEIVRSWHRERGKESRRLRTRPLTPHYPHERSAFSSDGTLLAVNTGDTRIRVWNLIRNGYPTLATIPDHSGQAIALSPDNRFLVTAGMRLNADMPTEERTIRLWELTTGREVLRLPLPAANAVTCLAFRPDGRSLVAGMADMTVLVWDLTPDKVSGRLDAEALERTWADLAGDAKTAYRAVHLLASSPAEAVPYLSAHLRAATPPKAERLARLLANLDNDAFAVREHAERELEKLGEFAEPALRAALAKRPSLEVCRRIEGLLAKLETPAPLSPTLLREIRAVMALEWAATPLAHRHLQALAKGADGARLTREAKSALQRLAKRRASAP